MPVVPPSAVAAAAGTRPPAVKPSLPPPRKPLGSTAPAQGTPTGTARPQTEELSTFTEVEAYRAPAEESSEVNKWYVDDARTMLDHNAAEKIAALDAASRRASAAAGT